MIEGGGRAAGYFTSATGVTIYTGDAWPEEFHGNAFIGDVGSNLVHRKIIERKPDAIPLVARRATPKSEFIASKDTWFRPVQFANAPDGNLYVLDMYRETIEHPDSLPPVIKKHLDLTSGRDRGRIYRVVREDTGLNERNKQLSRAMPGDASTEELVAMLAHPNGWHRTTAARLLFERSDPSVVKSLKAMLSSGARPEARVLALHLLSSVQELDGNQLANALADKDPHVRDNAARMAGPWLQSRHDASRTAGRWVKEHQHDQAGTSKVEIELTALAKVGDKQSRFAAAFALGEADDSRRLKALADIIREYPADEYISAAVFSSLTQGAETLLHELIASGEFAASNGGRSFLTELCRQIGARGDDSELASVAAAFTALNETNPDLAGELVASTVQGGGAKSAIVRKQLATASNGKTSDIITALVDRSLRVAVDDEASTAARMNALAPLSLAAIDDVGPALVELLSPRHP